MYVRIRLVTVAVRVTGGPGGVETDPCLPVPYMVTLGTPSF